MSGGMHADTGVSHLPLEGALCGMLENFKKGRLNNRFLSFFEKKKKKKKKKSTAAAIGVSTLAPLAP